MKSFVARAKVGDLSDTEEGIVLVDTACDWGCGNISVTHRPRLHVMRADHVIKEPIPTRLQKVTGSGHIKRQSPYHVTGIKLMYQARAVALP